AVPNLSAMSRINIETRTEPNRYVVYQQYVRNLTRAWAVTGTPGLKNRIGGIEKDALTDNNSYEPDNHEKQTRVRQEKVDRVAQDIGELDIAGAESGDVLVIGWGGTYGALRQAQQALAAQRKQVTDRKSVV